MEIQGEGVRNTDRHIDRIEQAIETALSLGETHETPAQLQAAVRHAVFPGGARLRPRLCLAVAAATADPRPLTSSAAAASLELLHCASLVHDDLPCFDDAPTRRGVPSVHRAYGEPIAVLAGDALIVLAFENLAVHATDGVEMMPELTARLARAVGMGHGLCAGQAWESEPEIDLDCYHRCKTGSLFSVATVIGAACGGDLREGWARLGFCIGSAYQVADDLRDVIAQEDEVGKPVGQDSRHKRPSAVELYGAQGALKRLKELVDEAGESIPECPGGDALRKQIRHEATAFVPEELTRRVA